MKLRESSVLVAIVQVALYAVKVLAIWIFLRGHQLPGGGFIAGLVMAAAVVLQGMAFGYESAHRFVPVPFPGLLGLGLMVAIITVLGPVVTGYPVMKHAFGHLHLPLLGDLEWATAALFDLGVFLVVVGTMKAILLQIAADKADEPHRPGESGQGAMPARPQQ